MATYRLQWSKPKCVNVPTIISIERFSDDPSRATEIEDGLKDAANRDNDVWRLSDDESIKHGIIFILAGAMFSSLHFLSWNFNFPSMLESKTWRVASFVSLSPFLCGCVYGLFDDDGQKLDLIRDPRVYVLLYPLILAYASARLAIMGVALSSLRSMPASVYITTWSKYLPNIQ